MAEVVRQHVDVIVTYGTPTAIAARNATTMVPIVVTSMGDPLGSGIAASLAHPAGNLTGLSLGWADVAGKWLQLLQETVPGLSTVAVIGDPASPLSQGVMKELGQIAPTRGMKVRFFPVHGPEELDYIFEQAQRESQAMLVPADPLTLQHRARSNGACRQISSPWHLSVSGIHGFGRADGLWRR